MRPEPRKPKPVVAELRLADQVRKGLAIGRQQRNAARDIERAERGDERRDIELGDQKAVDRADERCRRAA